MPITPGRDHMIGPIDAPVALLEYGDFECPFCGTAYPIVEALRDTMGDEMMFSYRHFPITTAHRYAWQAAEASEAAASQGQFWPYHHLLFEDQAHLEVPDLIARAQAVGLDVDRFEQELAGHVHAAHVQDDFLSGVRSGVHGTPTFFVNGMRYDGPASYDAMLQALQAELARRAAS
jgi:protein-disulfide isomerase